MNIACFTGPLNTENRSAQHIYLGPEGHILLCTVFHMFESSQIIIADDGRLQRNTTSN